MSFSALLILIFHLWMPVGGNGVEKFIIRTGYIGVDIFFMLSAYSLAQREITDVKGFYLSRFKSVYLKFVIFAIIMAFMSKWSIERFLRTISGLDLLKRGGGSFLWFLPAIMIVYLLYPLFQNPIRKKPITSFAIMIVFWLIGGIALDNIISSDAIFIFFNRLPALALGFLLAGNDEVIANKLKDSHRIIFGTILLVLGIVLVYKFGYQRKLSIPISDIFYVFALPLALGLILLLGNVKENKIFKLIGSATLEIYAMQMVFGTKLSLFFYQLLKSPLLTNLMVFVIIIISSIVISELYNRLMKSIKLF